ncbi:hypothetical protein N3C_0300 [Clostridium sp. N3C]|nr:hypothetical protein N3C_0300 [Clostridium sp. N3C]
MTNIEKQHIIYSNKLAGEFYFISILQEAHSCGLLNKSDIENIQLQCIDLLAYKSERYNMGDSSSIRIDTAESLMKSILYTIGIYLKSIPNRDKALSELITVKIADLYERGIELVNVKFKAARRFYNMAKKNKLDTLNYSYNFTLNENGIGVFFKEYNSEFEAHDIPANIDYQLCNTVENLTGIEYIQTYLFHLYLENEFCRNFAPENIHKLLYGYDKDYAELLINIFEQVLTAALGCALANTNIRELYLSKKDVQYLYRKLVAYDNKELIIALNIAMKSIFEELNIIEHSLKDYIERSLTKIASNIEIALKLNTLDKVFIRPVDPNLVPKIYFESSAKMDDKEYRSLIEELLNCRYSSDKLKIIKEKVNSFDDLDDLLLDTRLEEEECISLFNTLGDIEIAALLKRHPFESDIKAVDLPEEERAVSLYLENYIKGLPVVRQEEIKKIVDGIEGF